MRTLLTIFFMTLAAQVASSDLSSTIKSLNEKQVNISGYVYTLERMEDWRFKDEETQFKLDVEFAVPPKDLRKIKNTCVLKTNEVCYIEGKAELDTSRKQIILLLYQIDNLVMKQISGNF